MAAAQLFISELLITIGNPDVWVAIGLAIALAAGSLLLGITIARTVGLLNPGAPRAETLSVGLGSGLLVIAACWAAIWSGGRSSFTPVAAGCGIAVALALARNVRHRDGDGSAGRKLPDVIHTTRTWGTALLAAAAFIVAIAITYGATLAPSSREGAQPIEFNDIAFYAILGRDLAHSGIESYLGPSGFSPLPGYPEQTWYHWGETWLAAATIKTFGLEPMSARYLVVLPGVLLAIAGLSGTIVRRVAGTRSRTAFALGFLACLFLAPIALIPGPFFGSWAVGMIFGVTLYGLSPISVLLTLFAVTSTRQARQGWVRAVFAGSVAACVVPSHAAVALMCIVGIGAIGCIKAYRVVRGSNHRLQGLSASARLFITGSVAVVATVAWGIATGHTLGGTALPPVVSPFNSSWRSSIVVNLVGAGVFLLIPVAWWTIRQKDRLQANLYLGTGAVLVAGAIGWGARLGDFTMFYLFFAGIAVIATPIAAIAARTVWQRARVSRPRLAAAVVVLCVLQLELGAVAAVRRLQDFGSQPSEPVALELLSAMRRLPPDAKIAYSCAPFDESGFGVPQLLTIDAHTNRRVVPMCFEAELLSTLIGAEPSDDVMNRYFNWAPQLELYPHVNASPSPGRVSAFLREHGINYLYADARHPRILLDDAILIARARGAALFKLNE